VAFANLEDEAERRYLQGLPTSFSLPGEAIDRLLAVGPELMRADPDFQRLVATLTAAAEPAP
jgi:NTE family protein